MTTKKVVSISGKNIVTPSNNLGYVCGWACVEPGRRTAVLQYCNLITSYAGCVLLILKQFS